ncbi:hypothetical protein CYJ10_11875 [Cupriavidus pauculus]|uniref:Uncharacterized protein n=2 Tax=Cupriavidus pauculus TaxID=82633 RepID=A0A2N5CDJ0_9BURK|nr:hypothetical protein CYJ10_11875 [Cupriavidus pauculus]
MSMWFSNASRIAGAALPNDVGDHACGFRSDDEEHKADDGGPDRCLDDEETIEKSQTALMVANTVSSLTPQHDAISPLENFMDMVLGEGA